MSNNPSTYLDAPDLTRLDMASVIVLSWLGSTPPTWSALASPAQISATWTFESSSTTSAMTAQSLIGSAVHRPYAADPDLKRLRRERRAWAVWDRKRRARRKR